MSIKSDRWIQSMAEGRGMIEPYAAGQVREAEGRRIVSYGNSSYGYDVRCANEFKIFTNINSTIVDPKQFDRTTSSIRSRTSASSRPIPSRWRGRWNTCGFPAM